MLSRFFGERIGGVRFFDELDHAKHDPLVNYPVLELQHACLALGFQGVHRTSGRRRSRRCSKSSATSMRRCGASARGSSATCRRAGRAERWPAQAGFARVSRSGRFAASPRLSCSAIRHLAHPACGGGCRAAADSTATLHRTRRIEIVRQVSRRRRAAAAAARPPHPVAADQARARRLRSPRKQGRRRPPNQIVIRSAISSSSIPGQASVKPTVQADRRAHRRDARQGAGHDHASSGIPTTADQSQRPLSVQLATCRSSAPRPSPRCSSRASSNPDRIEIDGKGPTSADRRQRDAGGARQEPPRRNHDRAQQRTWKRRAAVVNDAMG